jgi:hypothetical protein
MRRTVLAACLVSLALVMPAFALDCIVADPTGTPLNIRMSPNGKIVATARKGTRIQVFEGEEKYDDQNRAWYFVALPTSSAPEVTPWRSISAVRRSDERGLRRT